MKKDIYEVTELSPGSWAIWENGVRCFLFAGTEKAMLVDSGYGGGNIKAVAEELCKMPVMLVNTHADGDHIAGNKLFDCAYMHPAEFDRYHRSENGKGLKAEPLWEGDIIDLGGFRFEVILIPGHTPGSIALLNRSDRFVITGDSASLGAIYMFGAGRNIEAYILSMRKLASMSNAFDNIYAAHGDSPLPSALLSELADGAELIAAGKVTGKKPDFEIAAMIYETGRVKFLC